MDPLKLKVGETYYLVTYFDEKLRYPSIDTFVYLGRDIFGDRAADEDVLWVFQAAQSYVEDGPYDPKQKGLTDFLLTVGSDMIGDFLSLSGLIEDLQKQLSRKI